VPIGLYPPQIFCALLTLNAASLASGVDQHDNYTLTRDSYIAGYSLCTRMDPNLRELAGPLNGIVLRPKRMGRPKRHIVYPSIIQQSQRHLDMSTPWAKFLEWAFGRHPDPRFWEFLVSLDEFSYEVVLAILRGNLKLSS